MTHLDKRLNAFRPDLADEALRGHVEAERFAAGRAVQFIAPLSGLHRAPADDAVQLSQVLMGETAKLFEARDGWAWVQLDRDRYVGYVRVGAVSDTVLTPTHRVAVPSSFIYPKADLKTPPAISVPMNALLSVTHTDGAYSALATGGFVFSDHLQRVESMDVDFVAVASRFVHTPYLWGGKSVHGIDCSGLVQVALQAAGHAAPRDSDMQERELGRALMINDLDSLQRGDLVFWKGHVGIMFDNAQLLHANGHHMATVIEPLAEVIARTQAQGLPVTSLKRI